MLKTRLITFVLTLGPLALALALGTMTGGMSDGGSWMR